MDIYMYTTNPNGDDNGDIVNDYIYRIYYGSQHYDFNLRKVEI